MDRPLEKKKLSKTKIAAAVSLGLIGVVVLYAAIAGSGGRRVSPSSTPISVDRVRLGDFREYVSIKGEVLPDKSVYLDLEEGGIVEKVHREAGAHIRKGDLIVSLTNSSAQQKNIETETRLLENLDLLRTSRISLTQSNLVLKEQLLDIEHQVADLDRTYKRQQMLMTDPQAALSREQFEAASERLKYLREKRLLLLDRISQEATLQRQQNHQIDESIARIEESLRVIQRIMASLEVRAPIDGQLSSLNADVGQSLQRGERIGQIDQPEVFKVRADVDQFYLSKVVAGLVGGFTFNGDRYRLKVTKIYPEVRDNAFAVDFAFEQAEPRGIRRGQTVQIDLELSAATTTNLVAMGAFHRHTSGRWVYRVDGDGMSAQRTPVVLGRQNPTAFEVIDGLEPGDWIVTSSYDAFGDVPVLKFDKSILPAMRSAD